MSELRRILVANRGEIASRIIRSAHDSNLSAVAIYTNSDKDSPYVKERGQSQDNLHLYKRERSISVFLGHIFDIFWKKGTLGGLSFGHSFLNEPFLGQKP